MAPKEVTDCKRGQSVAQREENALFLGRKSDQIRQPLTARLKRLATDQTALHIAVISLRAEGMTVVENANATIAGDFELRTGTRRGPRGL